MPSANPYKDGDLVDALRITDTQWHECLDDMNCLDHGRMKASERRTEERFAYRNVAKIIVMFKNYDGGVHRYKVRGYDMSESGLSFLHGAYIYKDTEIDMYVQHHINGMTHLRGTVVECVHKKGRVHHVGVKLHEYVNLDDYLMPSAEQDCLVSN